MKLIIFRTLIDIHPNIHIIYLVLLVFGFYILTYIWIFRFTVILSSG